MYTNISIFSIFVATKVHIIYENTNYQRPKLEFTGHSRT